MNYKIMPPIEDGHGGCLNCGYQHDILPMDQIIAVGFGYAAVTKNDKEIHVESNDYEEKDWTAQDAELLAEKEPNNDWRIHLVAPLSERHYQRQGNNNWVLYEKGIGFA